jgi:hypothetical protein
MSIPEIDAAFRQFVAEAEPYILFGSLDLRALAARASILPVVMDMGGCYALRMNGEVVSFTWDEPTDLTVESKPLHRRMVFYQGSLKYPALSPLVPSCPPEGITCVACNGSGTIQGLLPELAARVICSCGGLGWVLTDETDSPEPDEG